MIRGYLRFALVRGEQVIFFKQFLHKHFLPVHVMINASPISIKMKLYTARSFVLILLILLCSCAEKTVRVPGQDVSFISPPSDWEVTKFTSTSKVPAGGFLPIKFFKASWMMKNLSTIGITGVNISGIKKEGATRRGLLKALESEVAEFRKVCGSVKYDITNETKGIFRKGIDYTGMEADIMCYFADPDNPLRAKTSLYVIESTEYLYTLQFKAVAKHYDRDIAVFEKVMASLQFPGH